MAKLPEPQQVKQMPRQSERIATLPGKISAPSEGFDPTRAHVLLYGLPGVGKTTLCAQIPDVLFISTEPGQKFHATVPCLHVTDWDQWRDVWSLLSKQTDFKTVVIDTVDGLFRMCAANVCRAMGVQHELEVQWGRATGRIKADWERSLTHLAALPLGIWFVSHAQSKKFSTATGEYDRMMPTMPDPDRDSPYLALQKIVDFELYYRIQERIGDDGQPYSARVLKSKPSNYYTSKDRTGFLPEELDPSNLADLFRAMEIAGNQSIIANAERARAAASYQCAEFKMPEVNITPAPEAITSK